MESVNKIDRSLIVSEAGLRLVNNDEFNPDSWSIVDTYFQTATDIIANTVHNLYQKRYIDIEIKNKDFKIFQVTLFSKSEYLIKLLKAPDFSTTFGWLEQKIFFLLRDYKERHLSILLFELLSGVFKTNNRLTNPGKVFILESLSNQNCNFFQFEVTQKFFIKKVRVWQEPYQKELFSSIYQPNFENTNLELDGELLRSTVRKQLNKFRESD